MEFGTKLNNFASVPKDINNINGLSLKEWEVTLDLIAILTSKFLINNQINKPSLFSYLSVIVFEFENEVGIGITDDKTIPFNAAFFSLNGDLYQRDFNETIKYVSEGTFGEYGIEFKWFTSIDKKVLISSKDILNRASQVKDFSSRVNLMGLDEIFFDAIQESSKQLAENIIEKEINTVNINPIFKARDLTVDENMVFCVLPFNDERIEIFDEVLKPKLEQEFGLTVVRSGNIFEPNQNLPETIWTYINQSKFVIADISDKNANVFYELGICHTIGKPVISICDEESLDKDYGGRLPFDIGMINTIFYKNKGTGMEKLFQRISYNIQSIIEGKPVIR